jgi:hypothetical protein
MRGAHGLTLFRIFAGPLFGLAMFQAESRWGQLTRSATQTRHPESTIINMRADVEGVHLFRK